MSEYKFRVGDRVRVIDPSGDCRAKMGDVGTVVEPGEDHFGLICIGTDDGRRYSMYPKRFELVPPAQFKVGDLVKASNASGCPGKIGHITRVKGGGNYETDIDTGNWTDNGLMLLPQPESTTKGIYTGISQVPAGPFWPKTMWVYPRPLEQLKTGDWNVIPEPTKKVTKENKKMTTYYRTKQNLPDLEAGAILKACGGGYTPTADLWNTAAGDKLLQEEGQASWEKIIVENSPEWFERIYEVGVLGKTKYLVKDAAQKAYSELHKTK